MSFHGTINPVTRSDKVSPILVKSGISPFSQIKSALSSFAGRISEYGHVFLSKIQTALHSLAGRVRVVKAAHASKPVESRVSKIQRLEKQICQAIGDNNSSLIELVRLTKDEFSDRASEEFSKHLRFLNNRQMVSLEEYRGRVTEIRRGLQELIACRKSVSIEALDLIMDLQNNQNHLAQLLIELK